MGDFLHVAVKNLGFGSDPSWLWTVRDSAGKLISGGIEDSEQEAWFRATQASGPQVAPEPRVVDVRPAGEG